MDGRFNAGPEDAEQLTHFDRLLGTKKVRLGKIDLVDFILQVRRESADVQKEVLEYHL